MTNDNLMPIPGLGPQDVGVILSLLNTAGFFSRVHEGFGEEPDVLLIRVSDLAAIKNFLRDYTLRGVRGDTFHIPW